MRSIEGKSPRNNGRDGGDDGGHRDHRYPRNGGHRENRNSYGDSRSAGKNNRNKRQQVPQQSGNSTGSKRYSQQRAAWAAKAAAEAAAEAAVAAKAAVAAETAVGAETARATRAKTPSSVSQKPMPQKQVYYDVAPVPVIYSVPQFTGAAELLSDFLPPHMFCAYTAPPPVTVHPYIMSLESPMMQLYAAPYYNGTAEGLTYYSASQMFVPLY